MFGNEQGPRGANIEDQLSGGILDELKALRGQIIQRKRAQLNQLQEDGRGDSQAALDLMRELNEEGLLLDSPRPPELRDPSPFDPWL